MTLQTQEPTIWQVLKGTSSTVRFLLFGAAINQLGYFVQAYIVVFMLARGFSTLEAGWGLGIFSAGSIVGTLLAAPISGRIGDRNTIVLSSIFTALFVALIPFCVSDAQTTVIWSGSIGLTGVFAQMYRPAAANILSENFHQDLQVMGFSMLRVTLNIGGAIGPVLATALATWKWEMVFWFNAGASLIFSLIAFMFIRDIHQDIRHEARLDAPSGLGWSALLGDGHFMAFLAAMFLSSMVFTQFYATLPLEIEAQGMGLGMYSTLLSTYAIVLIVLELKISAIVRRFPLWKSATLGTTVLCLGMASFGLTLHSETGLILNTALFVGGVMVSGPTMFAYPARFPVAVRRLYISANQAAFSGGLAIGPVAGVAIFNSYGGGMVWVFCLALALISGALCIVGMREPTGIRKPSGISDATE